MRERIPNDMKPMIGVLAPVAGDSQYNQGFKLRMKSSGHELTLRNLSTLFNTAFDPLALGERSVYDNTALPASAYYLSGLLRANEYETWVSNGTDPDALEEMAKRNPLAVCVSTSMVLNVTDLKRVVARVRAAMPGVTIIVGGPLIWKLFTWTSLLGGAPPDAVQADVAGPNDSDWTLFDADRTDLDIDVMVISQHGSKPLLGVLAELEKGSRCSLTTIPNIAVRQSSGHLALNHRADEAIDWNTDFTRWDLVEEMPTWIPIRTSIGCPYRCEFCDFCRMMPKPFLRSATSLAEELATIKERNRRSIVHVTDEIVFAGRKRLREVCQTFIDSRAVMYWGGFMRAAPFIKQEIDLIKKSRFRWGMMGVESGDQGQLDRMNKRQKVTATKECIEALDHAGVSLLMTMLVGFPGENEKTIENTIEFLSNLDVARSAYELFPLWVFPMSGLARPEQRQRFQLTGLGRDWRHRTMDRAGAERACEHIFRSVRAVPYNYADESVLFNSKWPRATRRRLYELRRRLTTELMDGRSTADLAGSAGELAELMGFPGVLPPETWLGELCL